MVLIVALLLFFFHPPYYTPMQRMMVSEHLMGTVKKLKGVKPSAYLCPRSKHLSERACAQRTPALPRLFCCSTLPIAWVGVAEQPP